jgi:hypothetical protein
MGTTYFTDDTDEKQRQISGGRFIPPLGRIQSNLPFFIRFFYQWNRCDPWSHSSSFWLQLREARPAEFLVSFLWFKTAWRCRGSSSRICLDENATAKKTVGNDI